MKKIAYASWKGGTGKTLMAFNTLERATSSGLRTLGCDFDPQRMLVRQCALREARQPNAPELEVVEADLTIAGIEELEQIDPDEYDLVVCDMPGADSFTMDRALDAMDTIVIPISGAPYELINTRNLVAKAREKGWPTRLVANKIPPFQNRRKRTRAELDRMGALVAPTELVQRVTHWDAAEEGQTAPEFAPNSQAAAEIREYWAWLQGAVDITRNGHDFHRGTTEVMANVG